jgi:hypothetical protein
MRLNRSTSALVIASAVVLGGTAYAAAMSVDTSPPARVVIPVAPATATPAAHDAGDDKGGLRTGGGHGADDPADHDAGDDKGGLRERVDDPTSGDSGHHRRGSDDSGSGHSGSGDSSEDNSGHGSDDSGSPHSGSNDSGSGHSGSDDSVSDDSGSDGSGHSGSGHSGSDG